ncbi:conserved [Fagus crenata]|jgi:hypothetical protein
MEDNKYLQDLEESEEDTLSLCDLLIDDQEPDSYSPKYFPNSPSRPDMFEFSKNPINPTNPKDTMIFCGRVIHQKNQQDQSHRQALFLSRSESFNKSQKFHSARFTGNARSNSLRVPTPAPATGSSRYYHKSDSKKHKVLIGLAKIQPEMDLNEIRKRQGRRAPVPMFPVVDGGEPVVAGGGKSGGTGKSHWGLLRPLRCRGHATNALARAAFGCFPLL